MLAQIEQVVSRGKHTDPPAFTLILGAGASFGVVPTARQMLGIPDRGVHHGACIPAYLHEREKGCPPEDGKIASCVADFWAKFVDRNGARCGLPLHEGLPHPEAVPDAYKLLFSQEHVGGLNSPGDARDYLRHVTMRDGRMRLNGTHFFLGSLLSLQNRSPEEKGARNQSLYVGRRPFARTIFTTNFDPLLQVSLQLFQNLYYMTDRPEQLATDALQTDDHPAVHLFYAHGSVHRPGPKNNDAEITDVKRLNAKPIASYLATHGVIVLGYSGWDDCLLQALKECTSFQHNLYWLCRGEKSLSTEVQSFLVNHPNAKWVSINDGGEYMATLHSRLCPGMASTELLANPIAPLRERLRQVDLAGIPSITAVGDSTSTDRFEATGDKPIAPEDLRLQVVGLLEKMEAQFTGAAPAEDAQLEIQKLEHQANLAYSNKDYAAALPIYEKIVENPDALPKTKVLAFFRRGYCYGEIGREAEAIADFTRVIDMPGAPADQVAKALVNRGFWNGEAGRDAEAIADFTRVIEMPDALAEYVGGALANRGNCHEKAGRSDEAMKDFTRIIKMPDAPAQPVAKALVHLGLFDQTAGRDAEAMTNFSRAIEIPGARAQEVALALCACGLIHEQAKRRDEAIAAYTRAIDLPGAPANVIQIARCGVTRIKEKEV